MPLRTGRIIVKFGELDDTAFSVDRRRDLADAAEHRPRPETLGKRVEMFHAVEDRQDHRVGCDGCGDIGERRRECEGLDRQQYDIEAWRQRVGGHELWLELEAAVRADDFEPMLAELRGPG